MHVVDGTANGASQKAIAGVVGKTFKEKGFMSTSKKVYGKAGNIYVDVDII